MWIALPLVFLLPSLGAILGAAVRADTLPIWGLFAMAAFMLVYVAIAANVRKLARRALGWIRKGGDVHGYAIRTVVMVGLPILGFEVLARLLRGAVEIWNG